MKSLKKQTIAPDKSPLELKSSNKRKTVDIMMLFENRREEAYSILKKKADEKKERDECSLYGVLLAREFTIEIV